MGPSRQGLESSRWASSPSSRNSTPIVPNTPFRDQGNHAAFRDYMLGEIAPHSTSDSDSLARSSPMSMQTKPSLPPHLRYLESPKPIEDPIVNDSSFTSSVYPQRSSPVSMQVKSRLPPHLRHLELSKSVEEPAMNNARLTSKEQMIDISESVPHRAAQHATEACGSVSSGSGGVPEDYKPDSSESGRSSDTETVRIFHY